jgi:hypothetical protein
MTLVPIMWSVWGFFVVLMLGLKVYSISLTRDEDDHLILDDAFNQMKTEQAAIVARENKIQPIRRTAMWLVIVATIFVAGYYVMDFIKQFN